MAKNTTVSKHEVFVVKTEEQGRLLMSENTLDNIASIPKGLLDQYSSIYELNNCIASNTKLFGTITVLSFKVRTLIVEVSFRLEEVD